MGEKKENIGLSIGEMILIGILLINNRNFFYMMASSKSKCSFKSFLFPFLVSWLPYRSS